MTERCRICNKKLNYVLVDLGCHPPSNALLTKEEMKELAIIIHDPLKVYVCDRCWLVQVPEIVEARAIFNSKYVYYSSESPANVSHAKELVDLIMDRFRPESVLEIGSNDGYLLQHFPKKVSVHGVDPASGPAEKALAKCVRTTVGFFPDNINLSYDIICGINVFAHQPDLHRFTRGLSALLKPRGTVIQEFPHLVNLIGECQFDTIYHEHYSYFSLTTVCALFDFYGLEVFDVDEIPEHGGSLRIYAQLANTGMFPISQKVERILATERAIGVTTLNYYADFQARVNRVIKDVSELLQSCNEQDKLVIAYGGAAKGATLLNCCRVQARQIPYIVDRSPYKQGKFFPGCYIPIVNETVIKNMEPDYVLILPWNLKEEIMAQLHYIREWGGKFITAIPKVEVL